MTRAHAFALATLFFGSGCSSNDPVHPKDDVLRLNQLQMLATHNSYHIFGENPPWHPSWEYEHAPLREQLDDQGVRGFELDVHYVEGPPATYEVYHLGFLDEGTTCRVFTDCLREIRRWSRAHPGHHTIFVQIEVKTPIDGPLATGDQLDLIDTEIRSVFAEDELVTPDDVRGTRATLAEALATDGWPTLGATRGRVLFSFDCPRESCLLYAHGGTDLNGRVMFPDSEPGDPFAGFMVVNSPGATALARVQEGYLVRVFAESLEDVLAGEPDQLEAALASGAQVISTDVPAPRQDIAYHASIPGGTPSRCNVVTAPADCVSTDVEDPARLR